MRRWRRRASATSRTARIWVEAPQTSFLVAPICHHARNDEESRMHKIAIPQAAIDRVLKRREQLHVFNDIDPKRTAHIVVDLQNGFMAEDNRRRSRPRATSCQTSTASAPRCARRAGSSFTSRTPSTRPPKTAWSNWFTYMSGTTPATPWTEAFAGQLRPFAVARPRGVAGGHQGAEEPLWRLCAGLFRPARRAAGAQHRYRHHHRHRHQRVLRIRRRATP